MKVTLIKETDPGKPETMDMTSYLSGARFYDLIGNLIYEITEDSQGRPRLIQAPAGEEDPQAESQPQPYCPIMSDVCIGKGCNFWDGANSVCNVAKVLGSWARLAESFTGAVAGAADEVVRELIDKDPGEAPDCYDDPGGYR